MLLREAEELDHQLASVDREGCYRFLSSPHQLCVPSCSASPSLQNADSTLNLSKILQERSQNSFLPDAELVC